MNFSNKTSYYIPEKKNTFSFCSDLHKQFRRLSSHFSSQNAHVICIGTDKVIGDCLGPLVGTKLLSKCPSLSVHGTLEEPIHAGNLASFLSSFSKINSNSAVIAVDASVGNLDSVGMVTLSSRPLFPGKSGHKNLPSIGNISITGIVLPEGPDCEMSLSCTRLFFIDAMAEFISDALSKTLSQYLKTGCSV